MDFREALKSIPKWVRWVCGLFLASVGYLKGCDEYRQHFGSPEVSFVYNGAIPHPVVPHVNSPGHCALVVAGYLCNTGSKDLNIDYLKVSFQTDLGIDIPAKIYTVNDDTLIIYSPSKEPIARITDMKSSDITKITSLKSGEESPCLINLLLDIDIHEIIRHQNYKLFLTCMAVGGGEYENVSIVEMDPSSLKENWTLPHHHVEVGSR